MRYLFLLYGDEAAEEALSAEECRRIVDEFLGRRLAEVTGT